MKKQEGCLLYILGLKESIDFRMTRTMAEGPMLCHFQIVTTSNNRPNSTLQSSPTSKGMKYSS
jgi:hypothetical protein